MDDVRSLSSFTFDACRCSLPLGLFGWLLRSAHSTPPTSVDFMSVFVDFMAVFVSLLGLPRFLLLIVVVTSIIDVFKSPVLRLFTLLLVTLPVSMSSSVTLGGFRDGLPKTDMKSTDVGGVECVDRSNQPNKPNGREQRQASKVKELSDRTSSIKRHLSGSASCRKLYSVLVKV